MTLLYIIIATMILSIVSLVGIFFISMREELLKKIIVKLVTFATAVLLGGAIFHLLPEAFKSNINASFWVLAGIIVFFILEKFLFWRHCHEGVCEIHPVRYLNLIGDGIHNFMDGSVIAAAFVVNFKLGATISIIALAHEIPQEIGDFGILVHGGFTRAKALMYNLICAMTCILGGILTYFFATKVNNITPILIAFAGGNFLYMSLVDLLPEFRKSDTIKEEVVQILIFATGLIFMWALKFIY